MYIVGNKNSVQKALTSQENGYTPAFKYTAYRSKHLIAGDNVITRLETNGMLDRQYYNNNLC